MNADTIRKNDKNSKNEMLLFRIIILKSIKLLKVEFKFKILLSPIITTFSIIKISIPRSLILLKINALKAAFSVLIFVDQKLIKKNDVNPINSHPKNKTNKLPPITKIHMLIINKFINKNNRST